MAPAEGRDAAFTDAGSDRDDRRSTDRADIAYVPHADTASPMSRHPPVRKSDARLAAST